MACVFAYLYADGMDLADCVNSTVILYGIADNAMAGAILRCGPSSHVYIDGLSQWNDSERYSAFEVTGTLAEESGDVEIGAGEGSVSHGLGRHYVVKNAAWERVSDE